MNTRVFLITTKTNLHVGDEGGAEFSIIDKAVQRDALTGLPCIRSSSLKGSINEYCTKEVKLHEAVRIEIFGSDKSGQNKSSQKGKAIFFDAQLLMYPKQDDDRLYSLVSTKSIIDRIRERVILLNGEWNESALPIFTLLDTDSEMKEACSDDNLPIIARNVLNSGGISENIWYEQVIPAETVFCAIIQEEEDKLLNALDGKVIQIGANATVGYGYCKFKKM